MFNQIKSFFTKFKRTPESSPPPAQTAPPAARETAPRTPAAPRKPASGPKADAKTVAASAHTSAPAPAAPTAPATVATGETLALPVKTILSRLPSSLAALVKSTGSGDVMLPLSTVLSQLPQGVVKISFGQLRAGAPAGTFLDVTSQDQTMIDLPLPEILSRISPALLARRPAQKTVEIPADVGNVFGLHGEGVIAPPPAGHGGKSPAPAAPRQASAPAAPTMPKPGVAPGIPKPAAPAPRPSQPAIPTPKIPATAAPRAPQAVPVSDTMPATPQDQTQYFLNKDVAASGETLTLPLASLIDGWPDAIKDEIKRNNLTDSSVALPMNQLDMGLRAGKILFPWRQLSAWLKPNPLNSSTNGDTGLELPLKVIAPLFISQHRPAKPQKKVSIADNIPDVFSGGSGELAPQTQPAAKAPAPAAPKPAAPAPRPAPPAPSPSISMPRPAPAPTIPVPKPPTAPAISMPKPAPMRPMAAPAVAVPAGVAVKVPASMGELFGDATRKDWSPNEIVQKTSALQGMAGALMATDDGLIIAGQVSAPLKSETTAAFLPQIFGRMNQCGKELQVGDVNCLTIEFNQVPWHIVKVGTIYFAGIGKAGEPLPMQTLKVITSELGKQTR